MWKNSLQLMLRTSNSGRGICSQMVEEPVEEKQCRRQLCVSQVCEKASQSLTRVEMLKVKDMYVSSNSIHRVSF